MSKSNPSLDDVRARRREIAAEDRELEAVEAVLVKLAQVWGGQATIRDMPVVLQPKAVGPVSAPVTSRAKTKISLIVEALGAPRPLWQTANQIKDYLTAATGSEVPMSSISPALTSLKNSGTIIRKDMVVALALRAESEEPGFLKENEPPEGGSETGEPASSPNPAQTQEAYE